MNSVDFFIAEAVEPDVYAAGLRAIMRPMVLRWLLVAIGVALAVALIVQGYPLIGGLFGTAAVVRAAILLRWRNRRGQKRRRNRGYNDPG